MTKDELISAKGDKEVRIRPEEETVKAKDICYFQIDVIGTNGVVESNHDLKLTAHVEGGTLLGFGSANPRTEESFVSGEYTTYYGRAQAVVLAGEGDTVTLTIHNGSKSESVSVKIAP